MYGKILISLFFVVVMFPFSYSQDLWNPKNLLSKGGKRVDTTFTIKINSNLSFFLRYQEYFEPYETAAEFGTYKFRVELKNRLMEKPFQIIESESTNFFGPIEYDYGYQDLGFEGITIDINFDGFEDLRFKTDSGANTFVVNQSYAYYIYNPKNSKFEYNEDVSLLTNPTPFDDSKIIRSYSRNAFAGTSGTVNEYLWRENKLELKTAFYYQVVEDSINNFDRTDTTCCNYIRWIKYYQNKSVVKSDSSIIHINEIPDYHLLYW